MIQRRTSPDTPANNDHPGVGFHYRLVCPCRKGIEINLMPSDGCVTLETFFRIAGRAVNLSVFLLIAIHHLVCSLKLTLSASGTRTSRKRDTNLSKTARYTLLAQSSLVIDTLCVSLVCGLHLWGGEIPISGALSAILEKWGTTIETSAH